MMDDFVRKLAAKMEADMAAALFGPIVKQKQTALRVRHGVIETVELDDTGNIIEPPPRCPKCGPVLLCAEHAAMVA